jgi:hypothetical protein
MTTCEQENKKGKLMLQLIHGRKAFTCDYSIVAYFSRTTYSRLRRIGLLALHSSTGPIQPRFKMISSWTCNTYLSSEAPNASHSSIKLKDMRIRAMQCHSQCHSALLIGCHPQGFILHLKKDELYSIVFQHARLTQNDGFSQYTTFGSK